MLRLNFWNDEEKYNAFCKYKDELTMLMRGFTSTKFGHSKLAIELDKELRDLLAVMIAEENYTFSVEDDSEEGVFCYINSIDYNDSIKFDDNIEFSFPLFLNMDNLSSIVAQHLVLEDMKDKTLRIYKRKSEYDRWLDANVELVATFVFDKNQEYDIIYNSPFSHQKALEAIDKFISASDPE